MPSSPTPEQLLERGFTLDIAPFPDAPLSQDDVILYADRVSGRLLIARGPIVLAAPPAPSTF